MMRYIMDSSFLTYCDLVDTQHSQLFDAINSLLDACENGADREALQKSIDFLSDYTVKHFFDEEQLLKKHGFTDLGHHHEYHEAFKKVVRDLSHEFIFKGASEKLIEDVKNRIGAWLVEHIKGQDFRWAKELKEKAPEMFEGKFVLPALSAAAAPQTAAPTAPPDVAKTFSTARSTIKVTATILSDEAAAAKPSDKVPLPPAAAGSPSFTPSPASAPSRRCARYTMDSSFLTYCDLVDTQHSQLFDAINSLLDACENGADREALQKSIDFLSDYTVKHFFDEEQLLKKHGFTDLGHHHEYHEAFKKVVRDLSHEFIFKGASEKLIEDVKNRIGAWLVEHIKGQDFRWAKELKEKAPEMFEGKFVLPAAVAPIASPAVPKPVAGSAPAAPLSADHAASRGKVQKHSMSILVKMTLVYGLMLFAAVATLAILGIVNMRDLSRATAVFVTESKLKGDMATFKERLTAAYGDLREANGKLIDAGGTSLEGRYDVVDAISKNLGIDAGVFIRDSSGFRRVLTTMTGADGKRLEGVSMASENAAYTPLLAGKPYIGELIAQGVRYIGSYEPLYEAPANKTIIGALFVGVEMSSVDRIIQSRSGRLIWIIVIIGAVLLAGVTLLSRGVLEILFNRPVKKITEVLRKVGDGDIAQQIRLRPGDEIGDIAGHFDRTLENLKSLVMIIQNEAEAVDGIGADLSSSMTKTASAMNEINAGIQNIQKQVSAQAGSVSATGAIMEDITENINKLNSEIEVQTESVAQSSSAIEEMLANIDSVTRISRTNSENVARLAEASEVGHAGLQAIAGDMQEIARQSEGLLEINSVLQNIASQTNLLSMNAAIEAAHAGESGKGFAVVADEIRKLAESAGDQSKTISDVLKKIKDSITKISLATGEVLNKFGAIEADVKTVANQEEQIRNAMEEQSSGSRQILEAVGKLNEITRAVKSTSDEMQSGTMEIISQSKNLQNATAEITGGMDAMASRAAEVNESVGHVNTVSAKNSDNIATLKEAISHFVIKEQ